MGAVISSSFLRSSTSLPLTVSPLRITYLEAFSTRDDHHCADEKDEAPAQSFAQEKALAKAQAELHVLQETNRQMDEFISIASHEFRTPLTTLKANLQLVARRLRRLEGCSQITQGQVELLRNVLPLIDRATLSTDQLDRLINDLLDVSRIRAGALVMRLAPLDLTVLVYTCVEAQRQNQPMRTITVQVPHQVVVVMADADRICQNITKYLTNALKFSGEDKPVQVWLTLDDRQAKVSVRDEGPGLSSEEQERIWDRFHRAPTIEHKTGSNVGLGLGLYICKTIIDQHGGQVGVDSAEGQGATFWFTLPLAHVLDFWRKVLTCRHTAKPSSGTWIRTRREARKRGK